jgi:hypothetical protein
MKENTCAWCGSTLAYKKRGTRGPFCCPEHARLKRHRDEAKRKLKCTADNQ